jgi:hypothetical protein
MTLLRPFRSGGDLLFGRTPVLDARDDKPGTDEHIEIRTHRPVLFDNAFHEPVSNPRVLVEIVVYGPRRVWRPDRTA